MMKLEELEKNREKAKTSAKHCDDLIREHVEKQTFTGKELLDSIEMRKDDALWETNPYKIFIDLMREIIKEKEKKED